MSKTSETIKLTKSVVDKAEPVVINGKTRQKVYFDNYLRGFGLCVGTKSKTFFAQRSVKGRIRRVTIGRYGEFTVHLAREEAQKLLGQMAKGIDPIEQRKRERAEGITLRDAWTLYLDTLKTNDRSQRTIDGYQYAIDTYLRDWFDKPLKDISREDAKIKHKKIARDIAAGKYAKYTTKNGNRYRVKRQEGDGRYTANGVMRVFRAIYNRALKQHVELPSNPCINIDWFKEKPRKATLPNEKLKEWSIVIANQENTVRRDYLFFVLFTGLRRTSAAEVRWEHINFDNSTLHIPKPKGGVERAFDLPLSDFLMVLLLRLKWSNKTIYPNSPWVFPANSKSGHISEPKVYSTIHFTIHGLRHTYITVAESLDISPYTIKLLANHSLPKDDTTGGYIDIDTNRLREPMQKITDQLCELCV